jgi:hypothetical protein
VRYVGLRIEDEGRWDFGEWHWPVMGVQLGTATDEFFRVDADADVVQYELALSEGPFNATDTDLLRSWVVIDHPRWAPLLRTPLVSCDLVLDSVVDPQVSAPVAIRLATKDGVVWMAAAGPSDSAHPVEDLDADDVWVGHDEVIVFFDDARAKRLGFR